ncbi:hypothetical protein ES706_02530 [subsurface metagenome]
MKNIKWLVLVVMALLLLSGSSVLLAAEAEKAPVKQSGVKFALGLDAYIAPQWWSKIGDPDDPKFGLGFGGTLGVGIKIDDWKFIVGPHVGFSRWQANYSNKPYSVTESVHQEMMDVGVEFIVDFGDMFCSCGLGTSEITSGMMVQGTDIKYPYSGDKYAYTNVAVGFKSGALAFSLGYVSYGKQVFDRNEGQDPYTGMGEFCDRIELRLGLRI